jgi:serine/threonine-protein kinase
MRYRLVVPWSSTRSDRLRRLGAIAAWTVGAGGLLGVVFVLFFFMAMRMEMRSTEVEVPDLVGATLRDAEVRVRPLQLVLHVVDQRHDPRISSGRVLEQMPPAGSSVRRGRKLKLILSLGGEVLTVPDLVGEPARTATIDLRQEGFQPGDEARVHSERVPAGRVMVQVPPAESSALPASRVHRLVSEGPREATWVMPDLTGVSRQAAERWIEASGFRRGTVQRVLAHGQASGTVVRHLPRPGYPVRARDIVDLVVAE